MNRPPELVCKVSRRIIEMSCFLFVTISIGSLIPSVANMTLFLAARPLMTASGQTADQATVSAFHFRSQFSRTCR